jgi:phosphate/sulfate permease
MPWLLRSTRIHSIRTSLWFGPDFGICLASSPHLAWWPFGIISLLPVGEKIGKDHLTYGQGAAAELTAMVTIGAADWFGLPVSTTHVLSSGVAGTMMANQSGLQWSTVRNLVMAWVLTLPISIMLAGFLFWGLRSIF